MQIFTKLFVSVLLLIGHNFAQKFTTNKGPSNYQNQSIAKTSEEGGKQGDVYRMFVNNIDIPIRSDGVIADALVDREPLEYNHNGVFDGVTFLYSGGFFLAGKDNGKIWGTAQASAARIIHFNPGIWESGVNDPKAQIYVLKSSDGDFHKSWEDWKDAVKLGAEFYDGDGDGQYAPVDKNNNGYWDPDEDRPDLIGDETVWCAYHDGYDAGTNWVNEMKGINIRQTVFGYDGNGMLGNVLFIRYQIENTGMVNEEFDSVYFGVWTDPDLGTYHNDLVGSDADLKVGYDYDKGLDDTYINSPSFLVDILQGPHSYIPGETFIDANNNGKFDEDETALDSAEINHGEIRGKNYLAGSANLSSTSFLGFIKSHATLSDPYGSEQAYNNLQGLDKIGNTFDPCTDFFGEVRGGIDCNAIDPLWWMSGNPVDDIGWICSFESDMRMMLNVGPFQLKKGEAQEIIAAYVVGRDSTSLLSINKAKEVDMLAKSIFEKNFQLINISPEFTRAIIPEIFEDESAITLTWDASRLFNFRQRETDLFDNELYDMQFEGFEINMYRSVDDKSKLTEPGNFVKIASFDVKNEIGDVLIENTDNGRRTTLFEKGMQLDPLKYSNPQTGTISYTIESDPYTGGQLIKGKPYYISISAYALNRNALFKLYPEDPASDLYQISTKADFTFIQSPIRILGEGAGITCGDDLNQPYRQGIPIIHTAGPSDSHAEFSVIYRDKVKPNQYEVSFEKDTSSEHYSLVWNVKNLSTGEFVLHHVDLFNQSNPTYLADGVLLTIDWTVPRILNEQFENNLQKYFSNERDGTGVIYLGDDIDTAMYVGITNNPKHSEVTTFDKTRRVELRFGEPSKAYRYVKRASSVRYLFSNSSDPGQGSGFVDVPFSAYVKDDRYGEEYQLATGYLEKQPSASDVISFNDEKWNPGYNISESGEYIVIFNSPYDPTGSNVVYSGTGTGSNQQKFADIGNGYRINREDSNFFITDSMEAIAKSPWFDAMYVVALEVADSIALDEFNPIGTYIVNRNYPLTTLDKYTYTPSLELTNTEKKNNFEKINVVPNPFFAYNEIAGTDIENQFVTFINLPVEVELKIYSLGGALVRTLETKDKSSENSPFLRWDLRNENGHRVGSGMYIALVTSPGIGEKVLKFAVLQGKNIGSN